MRKRQSTKSKQRKHVFERVQSGERTAASARRLPFDPWRRPHICVCVIFFNYKPLKKPEDNECLCVALFVSDCRESQTESRPTPILKKYIIVRIKMQCLLLTQKKNVAVECQKFLSLYTHKHIQYMCMCIHIHMWIHVYTYIHIYAHTYINTYTHTYIHTHTHT